MKIDNYFDKYASDHKFIFYNQKNKKILIVKGKLNKDQLSAICMLKPHMTLYGAVKVLSINDIDGTTDEFQVIGIDKEKIIDANSQPNRIYIVYLSN